MQQLTGFLMSVGGTRDVEDVMVGAAHRIAEAVGSDVCAILSDGKIVVVGFPEGEVPTDALYRIADGEADELEVPGIGTVPATRVEAKLAVPRTVLLARRGEEFHADERALVRAMIQVLELALQLRGAAERERRLRQAVELQAEEVREVNQELEGAVQMKRDLVSMTSHELRTPLIAMLGFARLMKDGWEDFEDEERDEYLTILVRHGQRMLRLVEDLLTAGRLEDDRVEAAIETVSVSDVVDETLRDLGAREVELRRVEDDVALVDPDHLSQMVANLVDNARKYGAPPVEVVVSSDAETVLVEVTDAGRGVPEEFVPVLFDRFTQASTGFRREGTGVGLGLAIVTGLAARNGASVAYGREGGRTRFVLELPRPSG